MWNLESMWKFLLYKHLCTVKSYVSRICVRDGIVSQTCLEVSLITQVCWRNKILVISRITIFWVLRFLNFYFILFFFGVQWFITFNIIHYFLCVFNFLILLLCILIQRCTIKKIFNANKHVWIYFENFLEKNSSLKSKYYCRKSFITGAYKLISQLYRDNKKGKQKIKIVSRSV